MRDGFKTAYGLAAAAKGIPPVFVKFMAEQYIEVIKDAEIHKDFKNGSKSLTPVIFSHGLKANRTMHSTICRELVSYGCIVYAVDHTDTTCSYTLDISGRSPKDVYYVEYDSSTHGVTHEEYRSQRLQIRLQDINATLDHIKTVEKCNIPAINLSKLTMAGHSMGGMTSLEACFKISDFKLCISLDPYYMARWKMIKDSDDYVVTQPLCIISTERFHTKPNYLISYDSLAINNKFFEDCEKVRSQDPSRDDFIMFNSVSELNMSQMLEVAKKNYNLYLKGTDHYNQVDVSLNDGWSLKILNEIPFNCDCYAKIKENNLLMVAFMNEHKFLPVPCDLQVHHIHEK